MACALKSVGTSQAMGPRRGTRYYSVTIQS
jgi:hypothetical protein